jgi:Glycosyl transferase family 2
MTASPMPNDAQHNRPLPGVPFFTVLIPTMNRPKLLAAAVESVLWQTFREFELIVSDNSTAEASITQNRATMERHADDPRLRYIRPGTWMNMPDHWEFASRHASGRHVVVLTDRHVMRPSSLAVLTAQLVRLQDDAMVISWHSDSTFNNGIVRTGRFTGTTEVIESKDLINAFVQFADWRTSPAWVNRLPRTLNSCYRADVARRIREKHGRLFMPLSPDYTAGYLLLAYARRVAYLDRPLIMNHGDESNGRDSLVYGGEEYLASLGDVELFAGTPTPLKTVTNSLVRDLVMVRSLVGAAYPDFTLDLVGYFMSTYRELLFMQRLGSLRDVAALYAQWWGAVRALLPKQQSEIEDHVRELEMQRASFTSLRRVVVRLGVDPLYHSTVGALRRVAHHLTNMPVYADVLEAARETDCMISADPPVH